MAQTGEARLHIRKRRPGEPVWVRSLIIHPMKASDSEGFWCSEPLPTHYIQKVKADYNGERVFEADWSAAVSNNPYFGFCLHPGKGGILNMVWEDNRGEIFTAQARIEGG